MINNGEHTVVRSFEDNEWVCFSSKYYPDNGVAYVSHNLFIKTEHCMWLYKNILEIVHSDFKTKLKRVFTLDKKNRIRLEFHLGKENTEGLNDSKTLPQLIFGKLTLREVTSHEVTSHEVNSGEVEIACSSEKGWGNCVIPFNVLNPLNPEDSLYPFILELKKWSCFEGEVTA